MNAVQQSLQSFTRVAPFGMGFWDPVSRCLVGDGLEVGLRPQWKGKTPPAWANETHYPAESNPKGIYVAHRLPGLAEFARGAGTEEFWKSQPPRLAFVVTVQDRANRFQPFRLSLKLPQSGLAVYGCDTPEAALPGSSYVPLFSSPTRNAPEGMARLRVELRYGTKERPAAWACVRASHAGKLVASGYADGQGRASLIFPYPVAPTPAVPLATLPPLQERAWPLQISVFSNHTLAKLATAPELCEVFKQPRATLSADGAPPALTAMAASLEYGRDLVLRTSGTSHLLIKPV